MTAGKTLALTGLMSGTTVNLLGDVTFGVRYEYPVIRQPIYLINTNAATGLGRSSKLALPAGAARSRSMETARRSTAKVPSNGTEKGLMAQRSP